MDKNTTESERLREIERSLPFGSQEREEARKARRAAEDREIARAQVTR